jgi:hypothetical protein
MRFCCCVMSLAPKYVKISEMVEQEKGVHGHSATRVLGHNLTLCPFYGVNTLKLPCC